LVSPLVSAKGNNDVLASRGDIVVTKEDVERYIAYRIPEDKRAAIYASEKDLRQIMENIFVVRLLATQAENPDSPQLQWQANYQLETSLAELAQAQQVAKAMA